MDRRHVTAPQAIPTELIDDRLEREKTAQKKRKHLSNPVIKSFERHQGQHCCGHAQCTSWFLDILRAEKIEDPWDYNTFKKNVTIIFIKQSIDHFLIHCGLIGFISVKNVSSSHKRVATSSGVVDHNDRVRGFRVQKEHVLFRPRLPQLCIYDRVAAAS